jgi:hypothetical protein
MVPIVRAIRPQIGHWAVDGKMDDVEVFACQAQTNRGRGARK